MRRVGSLWTPWRFSLRSWPLACALAGVTAFHCGLRGSATSVMLFGLSSGAALVTVVGVLIEVPVMLLLVKICLNIQNYFQHR